MELSEFHEAVVVGAGQAGLATSYHLKQLGVEHVVLDKGETANTWRTQRWDSFRLNTPAFVSGLPGKTFVPEDPERFETNQGFIDYLDAYVEEFNLPVRTGVEVTAANRSSNGRSIILETSQGEIETNHVIAANGIQNVPKFPAAAADVPADIFSIDTSEYRNPEQLPIGAVLVVGSAQSGIQVIDELLEVGRTVYVATSKVGRFPRRYRGKDIVEWMIKVGMYGQTPDQLENPEDQYLTQPIATGINGGRTISLQEVAGMGAKLLGRIEAIEGRNVKFSETLRENIEFADAFSLKIRGMLEEAAEKFDPNAPPFELEPGDIPADETLGLDAPTSLDLDEAGITSIVWTTGFEGDYSWIKLDGHSLERGRPVQKDGASAAEGLYFVGQPWLRTRASGVLAGVGEDAEVVAQAIKGSN